MPSIKYGKECVCGRGGECQGVSAAFALLDDPRRGYVQLPQLTKNPQTPAQIDMNAMRASYLRHLKRSEESLITLKSSRRRYVALHHFHPIVVQKHSQISNATAPIPRTLKRVDLRYLKMTLGDEDRVRDHTGKKTKLYYFVPNYPTSQTKEDLKRLIRVRRIYNEHRNLLPNDAPASLPQKTPNGLELSPASKKQLEELHEADQAKLSAGLPLSNSKPTLSPKDEGTYKASETAIGRPTTPTAPQRSLKEEDFLTPKVQTSVAKIQHESPQTPLATDHVSTTALPIQSEDTKLTEESGADNEENAKAFAAALPSTGTMESPIEEASKKEEVPKEEAPKREQAPKEEAPKKEESSPFGSFVVGISSGAGAMLQGDKKYNKRDDKKEENEQEKEGNGNEKDGEDQEKKPGRSGLGPAPGPTPDTSEPDSETDEDESSQYAGAEEDENHNPVATVRQGEHNDDLYVEEKSPEKQRDVPEHLNLPMSTNKADKSTASQRSRVAAKNAAMSVMSETESELYDYGDDDTIMSEFHTPIANLSDYQLSKLPPNVTMESEEGRQFIFKRIVVFERLRSDRFSRETFDVATCWRGALEVLQAGIFETARAERVIRGTALANQAYGEAMQAIFDDVYIGDDGKTVGEGWKQAKLKRERAEEFYTIDPANVANTSPKRSEIGKQASAPGRSALLDSTIEFQSTISEKFRDNSERLFDDVVSELTGLRRELKNLLVALKRMGDVYVKDMEATEREVLAAFAAYEEIGPTPIDFSNPTYSSTHSASGPRNWSGRGKPRSRHGGLGGFLAGSFHNNKKEGGEEIEKTSKRGLFGRIRSSHGSRHGGESVSGNSGHSSIRGNSTHGGMSVASESSVYNSGTQIGHALRAVNHVRDGWMGELLYRAAVNHQAEIWEKCGAELSKILKKMQILEMNRRIKLHQLLLDFVPRQRRLYLGLAPVPGPVLAGLVALRAEQDVLREQVEESLRRRQEMHLQKDQGHRSMYLNRSRATQPKLESLHASLTGDTFDNGLMRAARILERKTGIRAQWRLTLAVVTADQFLHLFDVSMVDGVHMGMDAAGVFSQLLPKYDLPTLESGEVAARSDSLVKFLTPSDSLSLVKCTGVVDSTDPRQFEVTESVVGRLTANSTRKLVLRSTGREETQQWLSLMHRPKGTKEGTPTSKK